MIRSTKVTLRFANSAKRNTVKSLVSEYSKITQKFINMFWGLPKIPILPPKEFTNKIDTRLSARLIQCAGKQASGIIRGTLKKHKRRLYVLKQLDRKGDIEGATRLRKAIERNPVSKPEIEFVEPQLDARFFKVEFDNHTTFDGWITLSSLGDSRKISLPFKKTKHFNKLSNLGQIMPSIRISEKMITFCFEIPDSPKKEAGETIGVDVGLKNIFTCSDKQYGQIDSHGHSLESITQKIARRKKGSKRFQKATAHRKNYINWSLNRFNLSGIKEIRREDLKHVRLYKTSSRLLSHWTYTDIFDKLDRLCEEQGVLVTKVNPAYTSQTCPACGKISKANRKGLYYSCSCGYSANADYVGSLNVLGAYSP